MVACIVSLLSDECCDGAVHMISYSNGEKLPLTPCICLQHWRSSKDKQLFYGE